MRERESLRDREGGWGLRDPSNRLNSDGAERGRSREREGQREAEHDRQTET